MVLFYAYQRLLAGRSESQIWGQLYFDTNWQAFFDVFSSLPLALVGGILARAVGSPWLWILCTSMALHGLSDFLVHHDDAHRHFFPFSD
jgi:hypothetical protein